MSAKASNHRGDTLAKRIARFEFYLRIRAWCGAERFRRMTFCYLASFEGGDAAVLTGLGVPWSQQLAVDVDATAIERFKEKFPTVPTFHGDLKDVGGRFDCVFVDLCNNLGAKALKVFSSAVHLADRPGSIFAVAVMRGRESKAMTHKIGEARDQHWSQLEQHGLIDKGSQGEIEGRSADGRSKVIFDHLSKVLAPRRRALVTLCKVFYRSLDHDEREEGKPGTPMAISAYRVLESGSPKERERLWAKSTAVIQMVNADPLAHVDDSRAAEIVGRLSLPTEERESYRRLFLAGGPHLDITGLETHAALSRAINHAGKLDGVDVPRVFNLTAGEVAALKAHRTRGTYDQTEDKETKMVAESRARGAVSSWAKRTGRPTRSKVFSFSSDEDENRLMVEGFMCGELGATPEEARKAYDHFFDDRRAGRDRMFTLLYTEPNS